VVGAIGRTVGRHSSQRFQQLSHGARPRAPVAASADLLQQPSLDLLGLAHGGLGLAGDLLADVALAAGERVAAGVDLDLEAGASLAGHGPFDLLCHVFWQQKNDEGMTTEQSKASAAGL
jgi:hypothetical protein